MRTTLWTYRGLLSRLFILMIAGSAARAVTLEQLRADSRLTPEKFARYFAGFDFQYSAAVQDPEAFLARQSGDCDDYATLAAQILADKGYTARLFSVRMKGVVHVVCYIEQTRSYLDYNLRQRARPWQTSADSPDAIADNVSRSFARRWTSISEFTYCGHGLKRLVRTVLAQEVRRPGLFERIGAALAAGERVRPLQVAEVKTR